MRDEADRADIPPTDRLTGLWRRIKDHRIAQWTVGYIAVAYGIQHAVTLTSEAYEWPNIVARLSMTLLALGLPLAITLAWYHGERTARRISSGELAVVSVVLLGISFAFYLLVRPAADVEVRPASVQQASVTAPQPAGAISLAVLPFLNLSGDPKEEFFSDGMTEEITAALAKVAGLNVVARTSAFQFKGENRDVQTIAQLLHATHVIEGSVRKDGNEVRITAQLIRADNGTHLWTESFNRELKGVFAVQEEIATAIAASLRVPLGLKQGQSLVSNRTSDTDSYQDYLRARALVRGRGPLEPGGPLTEAAKLLEQVVARDPNYAPAWGLLGQTYGLTSVFSTAFVNGSTDELRRFGVELLQKAEAAAQQAIRRDPNNVDGYAALGLARVFRGRFVESEDSYKQALSLDPGNSEALNYYGFMLAGVGRFKESLSLRLRVQAQEPLVPIYNAFTAVVLWLNGRNDEAIAILRATPPTFQTRLYLAQVYASMARYSEAASALREIQPGIFPPGAVDEAVRLLRSAPAQASSSQTVLSPGFLGFVYLYSGAPSRVLDFYVALAEAGYSSSGTFSGFLWAPKYAPVRRTERFKALMRKAGFVDYWRARGWPDLCHPTSGDDFECS